MMRLGDHCGHWLTEKAGSDPRIWVMDGDLADSNGAMHFAAKHPERFIMAGIAEQSMVSMAAGMATCGLRPWVFSFASFLIYRAYDQIRICMSQTRQPVTLVGSHSGGLSSRNGKSHSALNDIALTVTLPHLEVWSPGSPDDLFYATEKILERNAPTYLRLPRRPLDALPGIPGPFRVIREPQDITFCTTGLATHLAIEACEELEKQGINAGLVHCLQLAPFPANDLKRILKGVGQIVVVEDHVQDGGLSSLVRALSLTANVRSMGWPGDWTGQSGADEAILSLHGLLPQQISSSITSQ